jgi:ligand-binding SRPBCC domain-containing protein
MRSHVFESSVTLYRPAAEVFAFFADAANLQAITPPWLDFRILTPLPVEMAAGTLLDYRIRLRGVPVRWRTRIAAWEPPVRFVDEQVRGPYVRWWHEHTFQDRGDHVVARDRVEYAVPGWVLAPVVHGVFVRREVERIFAYRRGVLEREFGGKR